jgi:hypothetical protein
MAFVLLAASLVWQAGATKADASEPPADTSGAAYADRLLAEINGRRAALGSPPLRFISGAANQAIDRYLTDLGPRMRAQRVCLHGNYDPTPPGWEYVEQSEPRVRGRARGEVLACPADGHFWSSGQIAETWWASQYHHLALYADRDADALACGAIEQSPDGEGFGIVACVVYAT